MEDILKTLNEEMNIFKESFDHLESSEKTFISLNNSVQNFKVLRTEYMKESESLKDIKHVIQEENIQNTNLIKKLDKLKEMQKENQNKLQDLTNKEVSFKENRNNLNFECSTQMMKLKDLEKHLALYKELLGIRWDLENISKKNLCGYIINDKSQYIDYFSDLDFDERKKIWKELEKASLIDLSQF